MKFVHPSGSRPLPGFTIKRGLGRGGFGEVYYATSDAGKDVALKLIVRSLDIEVRGIMHCMNLKNPHLIEIYDIREATGGETWVIMEYVAGANLETYLDQRPQGLSVEEASEWLVGIAAGVRYLHDRGIVHRDLKPGNIFREEGIVKLGDYGLSKYISASRRSGHTESIGTIHYMAPEVANGRYGKEIDIYAMGVMFYEMLTGRAPFEGESVAEILMKHLSSPPDLAPIPVEFRPLVAGALEKDPTKRFGTVDAMLAALPVEFRPTSAAGRTGSPASGGDYSRRVRGPLDETVGAGAEYVDTPRERPAYGDDGADQPRLAGYDRGRPVEPLAAWVFGVWNSCDKNSSQRLGLVIGMAFVAFFFFPLVFAALWLYVIYRAAWQITIWSMPPRHVPSAYPTDRRGPPLAAAHGAAPARPAAQAAPAYPPPLPQRQPVRYPPSPRHAQPARREVRGYAGHGYGEGTAPALALPVKSHRRWCMELLGSLLAAAMASFALSAIWTGIVWSRSATVLPEQFAMLWLVSMIGSWGVIFPAKFWEGQKEDSLYRRFMMGAAGLAVGAAAYVLHAGLLADHTAPFQALPWQNVWVEHLQLQNADGRAMLFGFMAYFGLLFSAPRWWLQVDPLRSTRFVFGGILFPIITAMVLDQIWPLPELWGVVWAAMIAVVVQISSPHQIEIARRYVQGRSQPTHAGAADPAGRTA